MEQGSNSMRERLLARLPQPENLAAYREETASLLAKHEKALATDKRSVRLLFLCVVGVLMVSGSMWRPWPYLDPIAVHVLNFFAAVLFFAAGLNLLRYLIYGSQVALLKEVKQIQLQMLELQASLQKTGDQQP